jgi:hypothetical protein
MIFFIVFMYAANLFFPVSIFFFFFRRPNGNDELRFHCTIIQGGSNMTGTNCDLFTNK